MMKAEGGRRKYTFVVDNQLKSVIYYKRLFTCNSEFEWNDEHYQVRKENFWGTKYMITKNDDIIGHIVLNWKGHADISLTHSSLIKKNYHLKKRNIWKYNFDLLDDSNREIASFFGEFNWRSFKHDFDIDVTHRFLDESDQFLLTLLSINIINLVIQNNMAAGAGMG
jgi:hypothetical protein